jgi:membrane protein YqaA with SNARE-associated domain
MIYLSLFVVSFLSATIFPASSELTLIGLISMKEYNTFSLLSAASLGNIMGSSLNWFLGFYLLKYINKKWFPFSQNQISRASSWFKRFGIWSLLFAWLPLVGDPLTLIAGILRIKFIFFIILVATGKILRYLVLISLL